MPRSKVIWIALLSATAAFGQEWSHTWGGTSSDGLSGVVTDASGNIYTVGYTSSFGAGGQDILLVKYDPNGNLLWTRTWGGAANENGNGIGIDGSGNIYVAGGTTSFGAGGYDALLLKFSASGNLLWSKTWGGNSYDVAYEVVLDANGNAYVAAESYSLGNRAVVLKVDPNGNLLAANSWKGPATYDSAYSVGMDSHGNVFLAGTSWDYSVSPNHNSAFVLKFDNNLNFIWNRNIVIGAENESLGPKVTQLDPGGNLYLAGHHAAACSSTDFSTCNFDPDLISLDTNGNLRWAQTWNAPGYTAISGLAFDSLGNLVPSGTTTGFYGGTSALIALKFDTSGNLLLSRTWGGNGSVSGIDVALGSQGAMVFVGSAPNAGGAWTNANAPTASLSPTLTSPGSNVSSSSFAFGTPSGTITSPTGAIDSGAGGSDALVVSSVFGTLAPSLTWTQKCSPSVPRASNGANMAYDAARQQIVLFGGYDQNTNTISSETWIWDGTSWAQRFPQASPPARTSFAMTYDAARNQILMFGGAIGPAIANDTWVWDGANWTQKFPATSPPPRAHASLVFDTQLQKAILIDGSNGSPNSYDEAWAWDGTNWSLVAPPPTARSAFGAGYDPMHHQTVVFGGGYCLGNGCSFYNDTELFDGTAWTSSLVGGPQTPRQGLRMAFDTAIGKTLLFGGSGVSNAPADNDTWIWDGASWTQVFPAASPAARSYFAMAYDAARSQVVLFGGTDGPTQYNDTWVYGLPTTVCATPPPMQITLGNTSSSTNPAKSVAEPINTATGDYYLTATDTVVGGLGPAFAFVRSYNSQDTYTGPLGAGWTHSYDLFLTVDPLTGSVSIKQADGHTDYFSATSGGSYAPQIPGLFDTLQQNADGSFTLIRKNQTQFKFSGIGALVSIADRNGNTLTVNHDPSGNLTSVIDAAGRSFLFAHDPSGHLTGLTDPIGRAWQYGYDASGNLISVTDAVGGVTQYSYDANHLMLTATDSRGVVFLRNTYDGVGRVVSQMNGRGFVTTLAYNSPTAGITTITDPLGNTTKHVYNSGLQLVGIVDATNHTTAFTYDANNDRTSVTDGNGNATISAYDTRGNLTALTDPLGNTRSFTYDSKNDLLTATTPKGNTTRFSYDPKGNLTSVQDALGNTARFTYSGPGLVASVVDPVGNTTTIVYDSDGNMTSAIDPLGNTSRYAYDGISRRITTTDPNGHSSSIAYDALSRITKIKDALGNTTTFAFDAIGNIVKTTDANGNATVNSYDAANDLTRVTDALGNITLYGYDANGNRTSFTNGNGNVTTYVYDARNRLIQIVDPLSFTRSYSYDPVGNITSTTDANGKTNRYVYDAHNRMIIGNLADGSSVTYTYDGDGVRTSMIDQHGTTSYMYDALDHTTSVISPGSSTVAYSYDSAGNRASLTYPDGRVAKYQYDQLNRLQHVTDWAGKTTAYTYDPAGNLIGFSQPNGASTAYSYDAANRLLELVSESGGKSVSSFTYTLDGVGNRRQVVSATSGVSKYGYDALSRLTSWTPASGPVTYAYDAVGNRLAMTNAAGTTSYRYDAADRLLSAGATSYSYDNNGNQISKTTGSTTISYSFDALNRLATVTGGGMNSSYQYDGDGNRIRQTVPAGSYQYFNDTASRLPVVLSESGPDGNIDYLHGLASISETSVTFQYYYEPDGLGSTASITDGSGVLKATYSYDPWGKLLTAIDPLGTKNKYKFTGEALDPGTGLYYLRSRNYDATSGRFLSRDPGYVGSNYYSYANGNPTLFKDPSGLSGILTIYSEGDSWFSGHSWISFTPDNGPQSGQTTTWATFGNNPKGTGSNGLNFDVELNTPCTQAVECAYRQTYLTDAQEATLDESIGKYLSEGTNAWNVILDQVCSSFAASVWNTVTGETLNTNFGIIPSDPLGLKLSIINANGGNQSGTLGSLGNQTNSK
jgi:RHS repeat-associated protein